jgi:hypothetical protein
LTDYKPTTGIKHALSFLGYPYEIKFMDLENVIYRNLNEMYDIEISGLDNNRENVNCIVYVWCKTPGMEIVEIYKDIHSLLDLKDLLGAIALKYRNLDAEKLLYVKSR